MRNLRNSKGFTLIELMIVVVIIGILAAIAIPKFSEVSNNAKQAEAEPILKQICTLAAAHQMREGSNAADIAALGAAGWSDPAAKYFNTWAYTPGTAPAVGSASAAAIPTTLQDVSMNCDTRAVTLS